MSSSVHTFAAYRFLIDSHHIVLLSPELLCSRDEAGPDVFMLVFDCLLYMAATVAADTFPSPRVAVWNAAARLVR